MRTLLSFVAFGAMALGGVVAAGPPAVASPVSSPAVAAVPGPSTAGAFSDVVEGDGFFTEITWLASQGITQGYADGSFRPTESVSREAMAAFVFRFASPSTFTAPAVARFSDVLPVDAPFYRDVMWLASQRITAGYADGTFRPTASVSREAMAAFLYRVAGSPPFSPPSPAQFSDVPVTYPFSTEIAWLAAQGITTGYADGTFKPTAPVSREAMAAFLYRYEVRFGAPSLGPPVGNPGDVRNCSDFTTWAAAQAWFDEYYPYYGDIARLDGDGDGIACQSLPGAP